MTFDTHGEVDVRAQIIDTTLKGFAKRLYKLKNIVNVSTTGAWRNDFFRASPDTLTAGTSRSINGLPRGAAFPQASTSFEKIRTDIEKYGLEDSIAWEDIIAGEVNVRDQTIMRIAEGVVYVVDRKIYTGLTTDAGIQTLSISAGYEWNSASAAILDNLEECEEKIGTYHYPTDNISVIVNLRDKRSIMKWLFDKGAQIPKITDEKIGSGVIGVLGNKTFIVSDVVDASTAIVVIPKRCATWKELIPLTTDTQNEPLKDVRIRAAEMGVLQVTDPKTIVVISNTEA